MIKRIFVLSLALLCGNSFAAEKYYTHKCWVTALSGEQLVVFSELQSGGDNRLAKGLIMKKGHGQLNGSVYSLQAVHECALENDDFIHSVAKQLDDAMTDR